MKRILNEPLLHFALLGAAIFVLYGQLSAGGGDEPQRIVITQGQIASMAEGFSRTWQRPPTREELHGLVQERVRDEVYCREAMALGLDKDDTVIRRRLRQKMEFVSNDIVAQGEPTEADLAAYLQAHPEVFRVEPRFTFRQVYLNPQKHGDDLDRVAAHLLAQLNQAGGADDPSTLGDSFLLEHNFEAIPTSEVAKQFGESFAKQLGQLAPGRWQGPVESGFGKHLVLLTERTAGYLPELAQVRDLVRREWSNARQAEGNEKLYQAMLARYVVIVEEPQPETANQGPGSQAR